MLVERQAARWCALGEHSSSILCSQSPACHRACQGVKPACYCARVAQDDWSARLAGTIAAQVKHRRGVLKISAQQMADRCAQHGVPVHRSVIANLENGRRPVVSVAELLAFAAALEMPALELLVPRSATQVELLPGPPENPWKAVLGLAGLGPKEIALLNDFNKTAAALHDQVVSYPSVSRSPLGPAALHERMIRDTYLTLLTIRRQFADNGWQAPDLPNGELGKRLNDIFGDISDATES